MGIAEPKFVEGMNRVDLNKTSRKDKCERIMNRFNKTLDNYEYIKCKNKKKL